MYQHVFPTALHCTAVPSCCHVPFIRCRVTIFGKLSELRYKTPHPPAKPLKADLERRERGELRCFTVQWRQEIAVLGLPILMKASQAYTVEQKCEVLIKAAEPWDNKGQGSSTLKLLRLGGVEMAELVDCG